MTDDTLIAIEWKNYNYLKEYMKDQRGKSDGKTMGKQKKSLRDK